jgi:5-methylcytosine-specific restriction endonuclease McrA
MVAIVIGMPLAKLQRFGEGHSSIEDRFIYDFSWREEVTSATVWREGFDDRLRLRDGVGSWLVRLTPLIRPLVQAKWAAMVATRNPDLIDSDQLSEFLFGAQRVNLDRVRMALAESQDGVCFYCESGITRGIEVDHFLPWSRHPDNTLDNLVAAHPSCNNAKSSSLAGVRHLGRWLKRFGLGPEAQALHYVQENTRWPQRKDRVLSSARAMYLWLPTKTMLWERDSIYKEADVVLIKQLFADVK